MVELFDALPLTTALVSTTAVALAEIGDKTQLLALLLAARFRKSWPIIAGILVATLLMRWPPGSAPWLRSGCGRKCCAGSSPPVSLRWRCGR